MSGEAILFEAIHGSAPDIAGKNLANPIAVIMAGVMMLNHIGDTQAAERVKNAVEMVNEGKYVCLSSNDLQLMCNTNVQLAVNTAVSIVDLYSPIARNFQ